MVPLLKTESPYFLTGSWAGPHKPPLLIPPNSTHFFKNLYFLWLRWVFVVVHGLLTAVGSLVAEHGFSSCGLRLGCPMACGSFLSQELDLYPPETTGPPQKSSTPLRNTGGWGQLSTHSAGDPWPAVGCPSPLHIPALHPSKTSFCFKTQLQGSSSRCPQA